MRAHTLSTASLWPEAAPPGLRGVDGPGRPEIDPERWAGDWGRSLDKLENRWARAAEAGPKST